MQYGGIQLGISSWWGQGHRTDTRLPLLLSAASGTGFTWSIYHEQEGQGDPSVAQIRSDLTYIRDNYASDPAYRKIDGKFVVFVYGQGSDGCGMVIAGSRQNGRRYRGSQGVHGVQELPEPAGRLAPVRAGSRSEQSGSVLLQH